VVSAVCNRRSCLDECVAVLNDTASTEFCNSAKSVAFGRISVHEKGGVVVFQNFNNIYIVAIKDNVE